MKNITTTLFAAALTIAPATLLAEPAAAPAAAEKAAAAAQEVVVTCNDQMKFDTAEIAVKAGEPVKLTLKNVGKLPKAAMGHNFIILKSGTDLTAWAMKAMNAKDTDFVPTDDASKAAVVAHTKLLGPGEEDTITFTIAEAGDYEFLCSFPGHFALMKGKVVVK